LASAVLPWAFAPRAWALASTAPSARHEAKSMFTLHADVHGLYPNGTVTAPVRVDNPQSRPLRVLSASVTIGDASAACPASNLSAESFVGSIPVAPHSDGIVPVKVHMAATAPDACQRATFPLTLHAVGELVAAQTVPRHRTMPFTGAANAILMAAAGLTLVVIGLAARHGSRHPRSLRIRR
jgi:hypothetical protein